MFLLLGRTPVLERASKSVWELILDSNGLGKEISETVERVFCKLSGREPPLFPHSKDECQPEREVEDEKRKGKKKENEKEKEKENSNSKSKKRSFSDMNAERSATEVAGKSSDTAAAPDDAT